MVRCPDELELERFLAGSAPEDARRRIQRHLTDCPTCATWLDEARGDEALLGPLLEALEPGADGVDPLAPRASSAEEVERALTRYRVLRRLGSGGMGVVFEAEQKQPRRPVALKVLHSSRRSPEAVRRFEFEAEILARLDHEGIARVLEAGSFPGQDGERPFIAMELVRGRRLDQWLEAERPGLRERVELARRLCAAVEHAHRQGVIHRDLKPANVLVTPEGRPVVLDFGVARLQDDAPASQRTQAGELIGTLAYMSPEQRAGDPARVDTRTDVYALGVLLYRMLSGELPHDLAGHSAGEALALLDRSSPVPLRARRPELDRDLTTVVDTALEPVADDRYASVSELAADLGRWLRDEPVAARPAGAPERALRFVRRHRLLVGGALLIVGLLLAGLVTSTRQASRASRAEAEVRRQLARSDAVVDFLAGLLGGADPATVVRPAGYTLAEALDEASALLGEAFADDPEVEARLRVVLGGAYQELGELERAGEHLERAVLLRRELFGEDGVELAEARNALGTQAAAARDFEGAAELFRSALAGYDMSLDPGDPRVANARANLGGALARAGRLDEAEAPLREALARFEGGPQAGSFQHGSALELLAYALRGRGRGDEARQLDQQAEAIFVATVGEQHPRTAGLRMTRARELVGLGRLDEAEELYLDALEAREHAPPGFEAVFAEARLDLGDLLWRRGESTGAERQYEAAHAELGPGDRPALRVRAAYRLGELLRRNRRFDEAEPLLAWAHETACTLDRLEGTSPTVLRNGLATTWFALGRHDEAEPLLAEALDELPADDLRSRAGLLNNLASVHLRSGDARRAADELWEVLELKQQLGEGELALAVTRNNLARALSELGETAEAERLAREAIAAWSEADGEDGRRTLLGRRTLAAALHGAGRAQEARETYEALLVPARAVFALEPARLGELLQAYGDCLWTLGEKAEAERVMREALESFDEAGGEASSQLEALTAQLESWLED